MYWGDLRCFTWKEIGYFTWGELEDLQALDLLIKSKNSPDIPTEVTQKLENIVVSKLKLAGIDTSPKSKYPRLEKSASVIDWIFRLKGFVDLAEWISPTIQEIIEFLVKYFSSL